MLYTITRHKKTNNDPPLEIKDVFGYTPQDRLRQQNQQINQGEFQQLYKNTYDYLGQLIKKEVGSDNFNHGTEPIPLQVVNYRYNIRGWLTHINNTKGLQNTGDPDDLFSFAIHYTNTEQDYQNQVAPLYNGNIAETLWRSGSDNVERSYGYKYDALNRLTNAIYGKPGNSVKLTHNYNEWLTYDKNGNILTLDRNGISDSYFDLIKIDQLSYEYANNNSNLLVKVTDDTQNFAGFKKGNTTTDNDFTYDDNGNLIADKNKNITQIIYNHLNLPTKITFNGDANQYISYLYNATGVKIQKTIKNIDSLSTTHYINGFQYFDNVLQFFPTPEGYVKNTPTMSGGYSFDYVYNYTDHLGNVRVSYTQDPQTGALAILEENHYYPFGLQHKNYNSDLTKIDREEELKTLKEAAPPTVPLQNPGYKYKFNGQEYNQDFGLNVTEMDFRMYDNALGRFNVMDEMSELAHDISPYRFGFNNPVFFSDPTGLWEEVDGGYTTNDEDEIARFMGYLKHNEGAENDFAGMMNFIKEDIAFFESFDKGLRLSTAYVSNGKVTDYSIHKMRNEIAYYQGRTDYLYNRDDYEMRNRLFQGGSSPISTELLRREEAGWYQPITTKNWVSYIGNHDSARMLAWASFAESMDGPSMSKVRSNRSPGSLATLNGYSASRRIANILGFQSASDIPASYRNMSFQDFHKNFSSHYVGKFKGRGSYMTHMARDWQALKAGL